MALHEEQRKLEREARSLALRLDAVLKDKFTPRTSFDSDTPIDKTLKFLQEVIAVGLPCGVKQCQLLTTILEVTAQKQAV